MQRKNQELWRHDLNPDASEIPGAVHERVNAILNRKQEKLASANLTIDALVIHTDEPWLSPHQMRIWTPTEAFARRSNITTAYPLRTYVPNYAAHWPVFKIY